jgi:hypothetical protein
LQTEKVQELSPAIFVASLQMSLVFPNDHNLFNIKHQQPSSFLFLYVNIIDISN